MGELRFLAAVFLGVLLAVLLLKAWVGFVDKARAEEQRQLVKSRVPVKDVIKSARKNILLGGVLMLGLTGLAAAALGLLLLT
jgi:hypothetical protein